MYEDFAVKLARVLTEYAQPVQPGNYVGIEGSTVAEPLIRALYEAVLRRGGYPQTWVSLPGLSEMYYQLANDDQLDFFPPALMTYMEKVDVFYYVFASANTQEYNEIDPARMARHQAAARPYMETYMRRHGEGSLRWNACGWPVQAEAQQAGMGLLGYTEFVYKACGLDQADPVAYWQALSARQEKLVRWLNGKHRAEVRGPGIEMSFDFTDRLWVNCDGHLNFPDGEIFTSPVEDSVNGHVEFSYPGVLGGRTAEGVRLTFKDGVVTDAHAAKGEDFLLSQLALDDGAKRLGEWAIGTNTQIQRHTGSVLFDEKIGGTIHMAIGFSPPETGGQNHSATHWDMVHNMKDGGEIRIDGELFYRAGEFMIG